MFGGRRMVMVVGVAVFALALAIVAVGLAGERGGDRAATDAAGPERAAAVDQVAGEQAAATAPPLDAGAVEQCRAFLRTAREAGVVRARPAPNRIDIDEALWAQIPATDKDLLLRAVACDLWQSPAPPGDDHVVAYGWRTGKRVQMLTTFGMVRE